MKCYVLFALAMGLPFVVACTSASSGCTPGASVACTGPGGCRGAQTCNSDGASLGSCVCGGSAADGSTSGGNGDSGGSGLCAPCWAYLACAQNGIIDAKTPLVYLDGTKNSDGSCTLSQSQNTDGVPPAQSGSRTILTLDCNGKTDQGSAWNYGTDPAFDYSSPSLMFQVSGAVYGDDGSISNAPYLSCGKT
jgi:hypothetical protein